MRDCVNSAVLRLTLTVLTQKPAKWKKLLMEVVAAARSPTEVSDVFAHPGAIPLTEVAVN